jgi:hypothetical protein
MSSRSKNIASKYMYLDRFLVFGCGFKRLKLKGKKTAL